MYSLADVQQTAEIKLWSRREVSEVQVIEATLDVISPLFAVNTESIFSPLMIQLLNASLQDSGFRINLGDCVQRGVASYQAMTITVSQ